MEIWKTIDNWSNYEVSNRGRIRNTVTGITRRRYLDGNGYYTVRLSQDGKAATKAVHRLVARAFIPNPENKPCVCHNDGDRGNAHVQNLRWGTHAENQADRIRHGTSNRGNNHGGRKLCRADVLEILNDDEFTNGQLASLYGVGKWTISRVKNGRTWSHVYEEWSQCGA